MNLRKIDFRPFVRFLGELLGLSGKRPPFVPLPPPVLNPPASPTSAPVAPITSLLGRSGAVFTVNGQPFRIIGVDAYTAPLLVQQGHADDVRAYFRAKKAKGFNLVSIFGMYWAWWFTADTTQWDAAHSYVVDPQYVRQAIQIAGEEGLYVELRASNDLPQFGFGADWLQARLHALVAAVGDLPNLAILVVLNEPQSNGGIDLLWRVIDELGWSTTRPGPFLMDSGDYDVMGGVTQYDPSTGQVTYRAPHPFRYLDVIGDHLTRKPGEASEAGKVGHNIRDGWQADQFNAGFPGADVTVWESEMDKTGADADGQNNQSVQVVEDCAGGFAVSLGGATFHSADGLMTRLSADPVQLAAERAFLGAMQFYPADIATGTYSHMGLAEFPFERSDPDATPPGDTGEHVGYLLHGEWWTVVADTQSPYDAARWLKPGWRVIERGGSHGQWLHVIRA